MPISPWFVGATRPVWAVTEMQSAPETGGPAQPLNITGATITLHAKIADANGLPSGNDITGLGTVNITGGTAGQFTYTPAANDFFVTIAGTYICQWFFDFPGSISIRSDFFPVVAQATV